MLSWQKNKKFIVLDADLSDDLGLKKFSDLYPKRFVQNGIAERIWCQWRVELL